MLLLFGVLYTLDCCVYHFQKILKRKTLGVQIIVLFLCFWFVLSSVCFVFFLSMSLLMGTKPKNVFGFRTLFDWHILLSLH